MKYHPNGDLLWTRRFGGTGNDDFNDMVIRDGYIYAVGDTDGGIGSEITRVVKIFLSQSLTWIAQKLA